MLKNSVKQIQNHLTALSQKSCLKCGVEKPLSEFHRKNNMRGGYNTRCKSCIRLDGIEYREKNKDVIREKKRKYHLDNTERLRKRRSEYYCKNSEYIKAKSKKYAKENREKVNARNNHKRANNINFFLSDRIRTRLNRAIRYDYKAGSAVRDLGCSIDFFKSYIESKFQLGMSWENRSNWHLDHIIPLSYFDLSDRYQFLQACHYTNYQPMFEKLNISKSNKLPNDMPCNWSPFEIRTYAQEYCEANPDAAYCQPPVPPVEE
jgi:hypothetical protein